jgi:hypothetical protein
MNVIDACEKRIPRIRLENWANPNAYLRLPLLRNSEYGPWSELYDDDIQENVLNIRPGSQRVFLFSVSNIEEFVQYNGPISPHEQDPDNYARAYEES